MLHCFLHDEAIILEFSYKTISIAHFLSSIYKYNYIKIFGVIFWLDIMKLLFRFGRIIIVFMTDYFCL